MPFVLIILGILLVVVGIRNTQGQLGSLIVGDFTGGQNFWYWIAAIVIIGALGYIEELTVPSRMLLALILLSFLLKNGGFPQQFVAQLKQGSSTAPPPGPANPTPGFSGSGTTPTTAGVGNSAGSIITQVLPAVSSVIKL